MTADKRQFGLFCTLFFVALLLWARIIVIERPPKTAIAEQVVTAIALPEAHPTQKTVYVSLDETPDRNPFLVDNAAFPSALYTSDNRADYAKETTSEPFNHSLEGFELEAIMGEIAMINGRVCRIGDVLAGTGSSQPLTIKSIAGHTVIISAGERRYELLIAP